METITVHLAVYDRLADWEVGLLTAHVANGEWQRAPGRARVATVGATSAPVTTMGGLRVTPDTTLAELRPEASAMLVLPGAEAWLTGGLGGFAAAARAFLDAGVPVAAICGATVGLAQAGLLDGRDHTSNAPEVLAATGYGGRHRYVDRPAVTDGDLVTASGTEPAAFAREALARLDLFEPEVLASWYKLYGLHDPAGYHELAATGAA